MNVPPLEQVFSINTFSKIPKYKQIINNVTEGLKKKKLSKDMLLPSINEVCSHFSLSRDTVIKAYNHLKEKGIIQSVHGKGFYIRIDDYSPKMRVFVLFDVLLAAYKEQLYEGIRQNIGNQVELDFYFHHQNPKVFRSLVKQAKGEYEYYVIMPLTNDNKRIRSALQALDQNKLLLLDINPDFPQKNCSNISQNHNEYLEQALDNGIDRIQKYKSFTLVFNMDKQHPRIIVDAFYRFCEKYSLTSQVVRHLSDDTIEKGHVYFVIEDNDLVTLTKFAHKNQLQLGKDIGCISYNDTPFKEIIEEGITVVSIDFYQMGKLTADHLLKQEKINMYLPTRLLLRNTL